MSNDYFTHIFIKCRSSYLLVYIFYHFFSVLENAIDVRESNNELRVMNFVHFIVKYKDILAKEFQRIKIIFPSIIRKKCPKNG